MKPELIVQSKSVKKHAFFLIHFKWDIFIKRNFKQCIYMRWVHDQINRKEKAGIQKNINEINARKEELNKTVMQYMH